MKTNHTNLEENLAGLWSNLSVFEFGLGADTPSQQAQRPHNTSVDGGPYDRIRAGSLISPLELSWCPL